METSKLMNNKEVTEFILNSTNNLEELIHFLEINHTSTIEGIINALYPLLKNYDQNKSRVQYLLHLLEQLVEIEHTSELKSMTKPIENLNDLISNWGLKQRISISKPYQQIQEIQNRIYEKEMAANYNDKLKYLSFLIFQDRDSNKNLKMIQKIIDSIDDLLNIRDENGENIFEIVLNKYLLLDEKNREEIAYFYEIILLFMNSRHEKAITADSKQYFRMIKRTKLEYKDHIIKIMTLLDPEFTITLNDLEERYKVKFAFPNVILREVEQLKLDTKNRYNFTSQAAITIDGRGSTCLDDALYIEKNKDGTYTLYIHIVDVPALIPYNSLTRYEASRRGETLYLNDGKISLYPNPVSDFYCSLLQNQSRCTQTSIYQLDPNFVVLEDQYQLVKGLISVKHQMTYDEADQIINNLGNKHLDRTLEWLSLFASVRRKGNKKKEEYRQLQNAVEFDPNRESLKIDYSPSSNIVHEAMVLENYSKAKYMQELDLPYIYRKLELPSKDFIEQQLKNLRKLDSKFVGSNEFLYKLKQTYAKSQYSTIPSYHMGINLPVYSHSSAPARRYVDCEGQYMVHDMIFNNNRSEFDIQAWEYMVDATVKYLNEVKRSNEVFSGHYNYLTYKRLIKKRK